MQTFRSLSTPDLLQKTSDLAARERELTLAVIEHLREVLRRRAFVEAGYSSLWDYVTQGLKYSSGSAKRRIDALHALREHPELKEAVGEGTLSLSTLSQVQSFVRQRPEKISKAERLELFQSMSGKSTRDVERSLAVLAPEASAPERARVVSETQVELKFTVSVELMEKLKRLQGLCAHKLRNPTSYAELLELLADVGLKELDPGKEPTRARESSAPNEAAHKRYVPAAIRREVWRKAGSQCTHQDKKTGQRCASRFALQVEHIQPFAKNGASDPDNLTLLCRQHNLHRAVLEFGVLPLNQRLSQ